MNVTDLDDEVDSTFAPGGPLTSRLEEMVAGLSGFEQLERHAARPKDLSEPVGILADKEGQRGSRPSSESASRGRATGSFNQPPLALTDRSPVTTSSKRTQQSTTQPRKRSQIIQGPPHKDLHSQPSAPAAARTIEDVPGFTTLLAADMQNFYQQVTRQFQALTNALDRRGVDVERPRLGLLSDGMYLFRRISP